MSDGRCMLLMELPVEPGNERAMAEAFERLGVFEQARGLVGGLSRGELWSSAAGIVTVLAVWEDEERLDQWQRHPRRAQLVEGIAELLAGEPTQRRFAAL